MQINGAQLANLYSSKPSGVEDKVRAPVIIGGNSFKVEKDAPQAARVVRPVTADAIELNDEQQSRFVRSFSLNESSSESVASQQAKQEPALPASVQQYIQVSRISDNSREPLLDERV